MLKLYLRTMPARYENQGGLLVKPGTNECAGYIFNFTGHGAFDPVGVVKSETGPTQTEIDAHNSILTKAERDAMIEQGRGTFYLTKDRPPCTPDNPRWKQESAGTWCYKNYKVSQWSGTWMSPQVYVQAGKAYGFCYTDCFWVWFTGPDGKKWYGVNKGDMDCFTGRRLKNQR